MDHSGTLRGFSPAGTEIDAARSGLHLTYSALDRLENQILVQQRLIIAQQHDTQRLSQAPNPYMLRPKWSEESDDEYKTLPITSARRSRSDLEAVDVRAKLEASIMVEPDLARKAHLQRSLNRVYQGQLAASNDEMERLERQIKHLKDFIQKNFDRKYQSNDSSCSLSPYSFSCSGSPARWYN